MFAFCYSIFIYLLYHENWVDCSLKRFARELDVISDYRDGQSMYVQTFTDCQSSLSPEPSVMLCAGFSKVNRPVIVFDSSFLQKIH